jgi:HNH endonuclease/Homing endonuclease associated repeat
MDEGFHFDLNAKRKRLSDAKLITALQSAAEVLGEGYFSSPEYDGLSGKHPHSSTIIDRFGSWKRALALIGIAGGRKRKHSPEELISNLEIAWKHLGYPPGKRQIATLAERISESPYKRHWGSVRAACEALAAFHDKKMSREQLFAGKTRNSARITISLKDRWAVLKRDNYRCRKCGASPSSDHNVELEIDHIIAVTNGGKNVIGNLQTLCRNCNQGKKNR